MIIVTLADLEEVEEDADLIFFCDGGVMKLMKTESAPAVPTFVVAYAPHAWVSVRKAPKKPK